MEQALVFLLALALATIAYIVASVASYVLGLFGVPDWLVPYVRLLFSAMGGFVLALLVAPFVYKRRR